MATKKTPVKRAYTRKPKTVANDATAPAWPFPNEPVTGESAEEDKGVELEEVQYLNLTGVPLYFKAQALAYLASKGYIWSSNNQSLLTHASDLNVDLIKLNHVNKLAHVIDPQHLPEDALLSVIEGNIEFNFSFSEPESRIPAVLEIGNAKYIRVV